MRPCPKTAAIPRTSAHSDAHAAPLPPPALRSAPLPPRWPPADWLRQLASLRPLTSLSLAEMRPVQLVEELRSPALAPPTMVPSGRTTRCSGCSSSVAAPPSAITTRTARSAAGAESWRLGAAISSGAKLKPNSIKPPKTAPRLKTAAMAAV